MNKVVVTGSSGFLGSHLTKYLTERGVEVFPVKRHILYDVDNLRTFLENHQPEFIIALHAYGNMANQTDEDAIFMANVQATWNLLLASKDIPYKGFVNVSSSSVTLSTKTLYSITKATGEELSTYYADKYNKPIVSVRPYSVYGEGEADFRFIPTVFRSCLTGEPMTLAPEPVHDWIHVNDIVKGIVNTCEAVGMSEVFDTQELGTGIATSNQRVVEMIEEITGSKAIIPIHKQWRSFDTDNWVAPYPDPGCITLREGLERCWEYYKEKYGK